MSFTSNSENRPGYAALRRTGTGGGNRNAVLGFRGIEKTRGGNRGREKNRIFVQADNDGVPRVMNTRGKKFRIALFLLPSPANGSVESETRGNTRIWGSKECVVKEDDVPSPIGGRFR